MGSEVPDYLDVQMRLLGRVIYNSAAMESTLCDAFCSLVGSKFAAIVAAGQSVTWLIEQCRALTDAHREMSQESREAIKAALNHCSSANEKRNHVFHGVKTAVAVDDGSFATIKSRSRKYRPMIQNWTPETLQEVTLELAHATSELFGAIQAAVSPHMMVIGDALGWEDHLAQGGQSGRVSPLDH